MFLGRQRNLNSSSGKRRIPENGWVWCVINKQSLVLFVPRRLNAIFVSFFVTIVTNEIKKNPAKCSQYHHNPVAKCNHACVYSVLLFQADSYWKSYFPVARCFALWFEKETSFEKGGNNGKLTDNIINHTPFLLRALAYLRTLYHVCLYRFVRVRVVMLSWFGGILNNIILPHFFRQPFSRTALTYAFMPGRCPILDESTVKWKSFRGIEMAAEREKTGGRQTASVHRSILWRWWKGLNFDHNQKRRGWRKQRPARDMSTHDTGRASRAQHHGTQNTMRIGRCPRPWPSLAAQGRGSTVCICGCRCVCVPSASGGRDPFSLLVPQFPSVVLG